MNVLSYIFTPTPGLYFKYYIPFLILAGLLFIGGIVLNKMASKNKAIRRTFKKTPGQLTWLGIVLGLLLAFRYERIPFFSMRFVFFIVLILILVVIGKSVQKYLKVYPIEAKRMDTPKEAKKTYLPNKKKNK